MGKEQLKIEGGRAQWEDAWNQVRLGDTVIVAQPGFPPVKFEVIVRSGGDGFAPVQITGEGKLLYGAPWPLQIVARAADRRKK